MYPTKLTYHRMVVQHHERIGHLYVPGLRARIPHELGDYYLRTNSKGFRSDSEFEEAAGARPRIVLLGDSFLAGDGCNNHERFSDLLGELLDVETCNYGLSGSAPDQHLLIQDEFLRNTAVDLYVWVIPVHLIERIKLRLRRSLDRLTGRPVLVPKPYYSIDDGELELHQVPVPRDVQAVEGDEASPFALERMQALPLGKGWAPGALRSLKQRVRRPFHRWKLRLRTLAYRMTNVQLYADYLDPGSQGWELMEALIRRMRARIDGAPLLVVPMPTYHYCVDALRPIYQPLYESLADPDTRLFVQDITAQIVKLPLRERQAAFQSDGHFSVAGHRTIARLIAAHVEERGLLPARTGKAPSAATQKSKSAPVATYVLGVACFHGKPAAVLLADGEPIAGVEEEVITRLSDGSQFPVHSINYCLEEAGIQHEDLTELVIAGEPAHVFEGVIRGLADEPSLEGWLAAVPGWMEHKLDPELFVRRVLRYSGPLRFRSHTEALAAAALRAADLGECALLILDSEELAARMTIASGAHGAGASVRLLQHLGARDGPGQLQHYSARYLGLRGRESVADLVRMARGGRGLFVEPILKELVQLDDQGALRVRWSAGGGQAALALMEKLFGEQARQPGATISALQRDVAHSICLVIEKALAAMAQLAWQLTGAKSLVLCGPLAVGQEAAERLQAASPFEHVRSVPGALGLQAALGAGLSDGGPATAQTPLLGPGFTNEELRAFLKTSGYPYAPLDSEERPARVAELLAQGSIVACFHGRLNPARQNGAARSLLASAQLPDLKRRFLLELGDQQVGLPHEVLRLTPDVKQDATSCSAERIVDERSEPELHQVLDRLQDLTGDASVLCAPLTLPGEPIAGSPLDAYRCFMRLPVDVLILGEWILRKKEQPTLEQEQQSSQTAATLAHSVTPVTPGARALLEKLYRRYFEPLAGSHLKDAGSQPVGWHDYEERNEPAPADSRGLAGELQRILAAWEPGPLRDGFQPIMKRLLGLRGRR